MRGFQVDTDAPVANGLEELNHHLMRDNQNEVRNGTTSDTPGTMEEEESRINEDSDYVYGRDTDLLRTQAVSQTQQLKPLGTQGSLVHWEGLLPLRSIKVLLVENDESTRHVVSALLQNCSYEVMAVAHGLEAWKILEDPTNHIDLVLTEVDMPYLSGIGLLSMIMNHKTCKNIPVIMMSSNDSMGIVFKCLSKGAADFLVKPIRKNELKTLWQHVWRKCYNSSGSGSGSGSESGIRTQKSPKSKSDELDNYAASNKEDDSGSIGLNVPYGSENGSGSETQSSWSRRAVEIDGPQPLAPWDELAGPPNTTLAQDHSWPEATSNNRVSTSTREYRKQDDALDLKIGVPNAQELCSQREEVLNDTMGTEKPKNFIPYLSKDSNRLENGEVDPKNEIPKGALRNKDCGPMGAITNVPKPQMRNVSNEVPKHLSEVTKVKEMASHDPKEKPSLEFSLIGVRDTDDTGTSALQHNVLRHSNLSAFSRYNSTTNANQMPIGNLGSCCPINNSSEAEKTESAAPNQGSNGSSYNDLGSTTNGAFAKVEACDEKTIPKSSVDIHSCSALQSVQQAHISPLQPMNLGKSNATNATLAPTKALDQQAQVQNHHHHYHHHHYHHHHHHAYNAQQQQLLLNHDDLSLKTITAETPFHGPCDDTKLEGNAANYGSASGSNNGSNGQNGGSTVAITEGTNVASDNGTVAKYEAGDGSGSGSRSRVDQNRSAQREAALNKFFQKRKERCFEKKVRYQSRKKLAEQRPRVRGQFVRRVTDENQSKSETLDTDS